ncbi:hypothetical protein CISIN_1g0016022mg, partial [Citrus sinensis]
MDIFDGLPISPEKA